MLCEAVLVTLILCNRSRTVCTLCLHWPFSGAGRKSEVFATPGQVHEMQISFLQFFCKMFKQIEIKTQSLYRIATCVHLALAIN